MNKCGDEQNGFRRGRTCLDHLYFLTTILNNRISAGLSTFACFVDCAKAFDKVNYTLLMYKMLCNGIRSEMYFTIKYMYNDLRSSVRINNVMTDSFSVESGVRQGDNFAPTLFTLYINDLIPVINELDVRVSIGDSKISILLYADDIVLLSDSPYGIQQQLNILKDWLAHDWLAHESKRGQNENCAVQASYNQTIYCEIFYR